MVRFNNGSFHFHIGGKGKMTTEVKERSEEINKCPECGSKYIVKDPNHAELYCADCGVVIVENIVDLGPEWRAFDPEQMGRIRVGAPMTYRIHDKGLSLITPIDQIPGIRRRCWQLQETKEKTFIFALSEIDRMASALHLPENIKEAASKLYRKVTKKKIMRGRSIEAITTAIVYIICRQCGVPRTLEEVTEVSRVEKKQITRAYRFLLRKFDLKVPLASPIDLVPRFCSLLNLSGDVRSKAIAIIKHAMENELTNGKGPMGTVAAAIYIAAILNREHRTEKEVADATGVTEPTIRKRYKELSEYKELIDVLL